MKTFIFLLCFWCISQVIDAMGENSTHGDCSAQMERVNKLENTLSMLRQRIPNQYCEHWRGSMSKKQTIYLNLTEPVEIYCDQDTNGGGWNVFQRRLDGSVDFNRGWADYHNGFGDLNNEFWLGLETLHQMTNDSRKYELRLDIKTKEGKKFFAEYDNFVIDSESEGYTIHFTGYKGNAGNNFAYQNNMKFTTKDRDNDPFYQNCAHWYLGGYWYNVCMTSNLNGEYDNKSGKGLVWYHLISRKGSLKTTQMKFRVKHQGVKKC